MKTRLGLPNSCSVCARFDSELTAWHAPNEDAARAGQGTYCENSADCPNNPNRPRPVRMTIAALRADLMKLKKAELEAQVIAQSLSPEGRTKAALVDALVANAVTLGIAE